jgi:biopolymer transport protein ExbB
MSRPSTAVRPTARAAFGLALGILLWAGGADGPRGTNPTLDAILRHAQRLANRATLWYQRTPPADRVTWGGLAACVGLGVGVLLERMARLQRRRVLPSAFLERFLERIREGKLDRLKGLDLCDLHPSPAARVALAALKRWGRPAADLERAVALAVRVETDHLRRNVGTLRRIAALSPLLGLLGTLVAASRALAGLGASAPGSGWGPAVAGALSPLIAGVALATLALLAYDGLVAKIEAFAGALDRLGAETVDAIAIATAIERRAAERRPMSRGPARTPHQARTEMPEPISRPIELDDPI